MSHAPSLNAQGLYNWAARSVAELSKRRAEINALNVFPVPDSDTGSNMAHTMEAALEQAKGGENVAEALAIGSVRGARGNSGMVLSQVLAGVAKASHDSVIDTRVFANSLASAVELVDRAIADPVEGTIITVLRAAAQEAGLAVDNGLDLHESLQRVTSAAREALEKTPSQLQVLRDAGVVDAGGAGLVILLDCLLAEVEGAEMTVAQPMAEHNCELEVMFYFQGNIDELEAELSTLGNSVIIARVGDNQGKVHIHSTKAGQVVELAFAKGEVSQLRLEVLPEVEPPVLSRRVFAVAPPGPVADIFTAVGAEIVAPETTSIAATSADIFLKNGADCAAGQAQVVPTESLVAGIAAISVYDPHADLEDTVSAMKDAASSMRVLKPAAHTFDGLIIAARQLLEAGGEQVTILSPHPVDSQALTKRLGVEVMALSAPGIDAEVGVE